MEVRVGPRAERVVRGLLTERPRPRSVREHPRAWVFAVVTVCFGAFMGQLDASVVTLTYQPLRDRFGVSAGAVEWVSLGYLLALVALLVPVGRLADRHGRKLLYLYGFGLFTAASAACGLAWSLGALIAFRVAQAAGAALLQANSVALVTTSAPPDRARAALGMQAAAQALGLALGPTVGGVLVDAAGWRWVFWVNVPVGVVALAAGRLLLPRTRYAAPAGGGRSAGPARLDLPGLALLVTATTTGLLALSAFSGLRLPGGGTTGPAPAAALALAATAGFAVRQWRAAEPLVDRAVLAPPAVRRGLAGALCAYLVLFGPLVLVPEALAERGWSAAGAGLLLSALPAGFALAATFGERLLPGALGDSGRGVLGGAVCCVALAALLALPVAGVAWAGPLALLGAGLGVYAPANNAAVMRAVPRALAGTGGGLVSMARGLGTALGVALVTAALHTPGGGADRAFLALLGAAAAATVLACRPSRRPPTPFTPRTPPRGRRTHRPAGPPPTPGCSPRR
jgi:MFS family permease